MKAQKRILLSGGHTGLGLVLTKKLIEEGHRVGLIVRDEHRRNDALKEFDEDVSIDFFFADLSDQKEVENVVDEIKSKWTHLDVLFNNAGVLINEKKMSKQDNEMHFEVNTLSTYAITVGLKELLLKSNNPVVVNTATGLLQNRKINVKELVDPRKPKGILRSYMASKYALLSLMIDLSKDWKDIRIINVHPGASRTSMTTGRGVPLFLKPIVFLISGKPEDGADLLYQGAFDEQHRDKTGLYLQANINTPLKFEITEEQKNGILERLKTAQTIMEP